MPHTTRSHAADVRAAYTGEHLAAARMGVGRSGDHGLDRCTAAQRLLRATMGMYLLNSGRDGVPYALGGTSTALRYSVTMSARDDLLVMVMDRAVENLIGRIVSKATNLDSGIAGLRLVAARPMRVYHLVHLPTAARLIITDGLRQFRTTDAARRPTKATPYLDLDMPLSAEERQALAAVGTMAPGIAQMVAGIVVRIGAHDPEGRWDLRHWDGSCSRLQGDESLWDLRWRGDPDPADVAHALTDPMLGMRHATCDRRGQAWCVRLAGSVLRLGR